MALAESDLLVGIAEVAIVFAGFSGISVVLNRHDLSSWTATDSMRLVIIVEGGIVLALMSLLPIALAGVGLREAAVWALSSAALAAYFAGNAIRILRRIQGPYWDAIGERESIPWMVVSLGMVVLSTGILLMNALGILFVRGSGPYLTGLCFGMAMTARVFVRSLSALRGGPPPGP